jgi:hypothetical protein
MKNYFVLSALIIFAGFLPLNGQAQNKKIDKVNLLYLQKLNDSLGKEGIHILDEIMPVNRIKSDSLFTRMLVRGLLIPYSFYFPFDSVVTAPILYPQDSSFRIITWHYTLNDADFRQKGVLQINTPDGSPKFFPLFDVSDYTDEPQDSIRDNKNWIGAVYYKILQHEWQGKNIYSLIGYDENNSLTTRKWIETLTFGENGEPLFGGNYFRIPYNNTFTKGSRRYLMEYKSGSRARLNYDDEEGMIIMDFLVSETGEPDKRYTLVPGGDYSGFKWKNGAWEYIPRLDVEMLGDGNEPHPALILNDDGTAKEDVLQKQSDKNVKQAQPAVKTPPAKPKKGSE